MLCERSFENRLKKWQWRLSFANNYNYKGNCYSSYVYLFICTRHSTESDLLFSVLGFVMKLTSIIFCIIWKVLVKSKLRCYLLSKANYPSAIDLVLTFLWILSLETSVYSIFRTILSVQCAEEDLHGRKIAYRYWRILNHPGSFYTCPKSGFVWFFKTLTQTNKSYSVFCCRYFIENCNCMDISNIANIPN